MNDGEEEAERMYMYMELASKSAAAPIQFRHFLMHQKVDTDTAQAHRQVDINTSEAGIDTRERTCCW